jgi:hypothetical protein
MILFIIYNSISVVILLENYAIKSISLIIIIISIMKYIKINRNMIYRDYIIKKTERIFLGMILISFSLMFIFRGTYQINEFLSENINIIELSVSLSDIVVCIIWLVVGISFIKNRKFGNMNVFSIYFQACLLFMTLTLYLIINPMIEKTKIDFESLLAIILMSMIFYIPFLKIIFNERKNKT